MDGSFGKAVSFGIISYIPFIRDMINRGEYEIHYGETSISLIYRMISGDTITRKITFPEGMTTKMIVQKLYETDSLRGDVKDIPDEGSLMPDTYFYKKGDSREDIIQKMKNEMQNFIQKNLKNKTKKEIEKIMIIASIIEKETSIDEERALISSVYNNRLKINMRLQSCPTVIYALSNGYGKIDHKLNKNDLFFKSPYNTYRNNGLPPSPICCPGRKSILASMKPSNTNFLYFVADPNTHHHSFSKDYEQHIKNKKQSKENH